MHLRSKIAIQSRKYGEGEEPIIMLLSTRRSGCLLPGPWWRLAFMIEMVELE